MIEAASPAACQSLMMCVRRLRRLRAGDMLVTDASPRAIRSGQTDAKLLRKLHHMGVVIYSREGLHSKVALFGNHVIVDSANMSGSNLIEASVITDNPVIAFSGPYEHRTCAPFRAKIPPRWSYFSHLLKR
jgi:hypothetical protein